MLQLTTSHWSLTTALLLRFLVRLVLAAAVTELLELQTAGGRLLVLRRRVIPLLALSALQCNNFPHFQILPVLSSQFVHPRLHDPGWRPHSDRHRRPRLPLQR